VTTSLNNSSLTGVQFSEFGLDENKDYGLYLYTSILNLFTFICEIGATDPSDNIYDPILIDPVRVWVVEHYSSLKNMILMIKDHGPRIGSSIGSIGESAILLESISTMNALNKHYHMATKEGLNGGVVDVHVNNIIEAFEENITEPVQQTNKPRRGSVDLLTSDHSDGSGDVNTNEPQPEGKKTELCSEGESDELGVEDTSCISGDPELVNFVITKIPEFLVRTDINTRYATLSCVAKMVKSNISIQLPIGLIQSIVDMLVPTAWQKSEGKSNRRVSGTQDEDTAIIDYNGILATDNDGHEDSISLSISFKSLDVIRHILGPHNIETLGNDCLTKLMNLYELNIDETTDLVTALSRCLAESLNSYDQDLQHHVLPMWLRLYSTVPYGVLPEQDLTRVVSLLEQHSKLNSDLFKKVTFPQLQKMVSDMLDTPEKFQPTNNVHHELWCNHPERLQYVALPILLFYSSIIGNDVLDSPLNHSNFNFDMFCSKLINHLLWRLKMSSNFYIFNGIFTSRTCVPLNSVLDDEEEMAGSETYKQGEFCAVILSTLGLSLVKLVNRKDMSSEQKQICHKLMDLIDSSVDLFDNFPILYTLYKEYHYLASNGKNISTVSLVSTLINRRDDHTNSKQSVKGSISLLDSPTIPNAVDSMINEPNMRSISTEQSDRPTLRNTSLVSINSEESRGHENLLDSQNDTLLDSQNEEQRAQTTINKKEEEGIQNKMNLLDDLIG